MGRKLFNIKNMAIVAVFSLIAFVSFNSFINKDNTAEQKMTTQWYKFKTSVSLNPTRSEALEPSNYEPVGETPPCSSDEIFCGVLADDNSGLPDLGSSTTANSVINAYFDNPSTYTSPYIVERD